MSENVAIYTKEIVLYSFTIIYSNHKSIWSSRPNPKKCFSQNNCDEKRKQIKKLSFSFLFVKYILHFSIILLGF